VYSAYILGVCVCVALGAGTALPVLVRTPMALTKRPGGWRAGAHATGGGCRPMCEEGSREEGRTVYILDICSFTAFIDFTAFRPVICSPHLSSRVATSRSARTLHGTMLSRLAPRRRALSSATRALRPLRVGGVPEHFNTPWHTAHAAGRFDELGLQVDS